MAGDNRVASHRVELDAAVTAIELSLSPVRRRRVRVLVAFSRAC
jgi:hypothetical protein